MKKLAGNILAGRRLRTEANQGWHPNSKVSMGFSVAHLLRLKKTTLLFTSCLPSLPAWFCQLWKSHLSTQKRLSIIRRLFFVEQSICWTVPLGQGCGLARKFSLILWKEGSFNGAWNQFLGKSFSFALMARLRELSFLIFILQTFRCFYFPF